ncbi:MAG: hypothetical protein WAM14_05985 [Candidatus Nitrosopolaris sp.]
MTSNVIRCPRCNQSLISEEFASHKCSCRIVDIVYKWWVNADVSGMGQVVVVEGKDGTLYRIRPDPTK